MAPFIAEEDSARIETIVNVLFDSGYYEKIQVTNYEGDDLFTALRSPDISDDVPRWFVKLIAFDTPILRQEVTHSWSKVGFIVIKSRAGYAYDELWKGTQTTLIWFITLSLICVFFLSSLIRLILRPLKSIENQAKALSNKEYLEATDIPKTKELRSVVITMNSMIKRVQTMFDEQSKSIEELRRTAYIDELTGIANSRSTTAQLYDKLDSRDDEGPCAIFYLHISKLTELNEKLGQENVNNLIKQVADKLSAIGKNYTGSLVGRLTGSDLVLLISRPDNETITREINTLLDSYKQIFRFYHPHSQDDIPIHIAIVFSEEKISSAQVLSVARIGIEEAIANNQSSIYKTSSNTDSDTSSDDWKAHVVEAINGKKLFLQYQEVLDSSESAIIHKELLVRILNQQGDPCAAIRFIRIVKELGLIEALDKAVIEHAINHLSNNDNSEPLAVNISQDTLHVEKFDQWLLSTIKDQNLAGKLNIEINESSVLNDVDRVVRFRQLLNSNGIGFGVDNFGVHPSGFSYLYKVQPDYIKIDGSLCRDIEGSAEDRFFIGSLITVANSLSIPSYAERIEHTAQIEQLQKLGIGATQGFIHGKPKNLV
ncbi:MAG: EAL domain-containing protein (putative c-di-GMP-specific phosphodiesterase class I) [Oceanospirillaceae bacterium]|jgi:EAL domain-containing protein (putative c-di-GMP-specific phosphodiesterase class I)